MYENTENHFIYSICKFKYKSSKKKLMENNNIQLYFEKKINEKSYKKIT